MIGWWPGLVPIVVPLAAAAGVFLAQAVAPPSSPPQPPPNTWVDMQAGGVARGTGVGDEGYSTFVYAPGIAKGLVFGQYHAVDVGSGEDQNALLAYDFAHNRWELLEVTEAAWSEFLPGVGHDQGNATVDPGNDLYIIRGNMTLHGNTAFQTYVFDLRAGRGRRMMPPQEPRGLNEEVAMAFSPDHGIALLTKGPSAVYDPVANVWTSFPGPSKRQAPSLVYDTRHKLFIMFGGGMLDETWVFDPASRKWSQRTPTPSPPGRKGAGFAYDPDRGVALLVGGVAGKRHEPLQDAWVYDARADRWTALAPPPFRGGNEAGNNLIYDNRHKVFLYKGGGNLTKVWAFRYQPPS